MNPLKIIRKLGKALRGGAAFREIFLAALFGFAAGMIPGMNLTLLALLLLLFLLNVNGGVGAVSLGIGKVVAFALAPLTFRIGYLMIHSLGLEGLVRAFGDTPVLALLDLQVYCLMGALPLAVILGGVYAFFLTRAILGLRGRMAAAMEKDGAAAKVAGNKLVSALLWLAFGGKKKDAAEDAEKKSPLFVKSRLVAGGVLAAIAALSLYLFADDAVKYGIREGIASATGAEVNVEDASLSFSAGRLVLTGLQVTDPEKPTHNTFQAASLTAQVSGRDLLAKRLIIDRLASDAARLGAERETPGEVYAAPPPDEAEPAPALPADLGKVKEYYERVKQLKEDLDKLREYMEEDEAAEAAKAPASRKEALLREAEINGYFSLSATEVLSESPTWVIREMEMKNVKLTPELPPVTITGTNLSDRPSVAGKPRLAVKPDESGVEALKNQLKEGAMDKVKEKAGGLGDKVKGLFGR